jgi:hypothetical protein
MHHEFMVHSFIAKRDSNCLLLSQGIDAKEALT